MTEVIYPHDSVKNQKNNRINQKNATLSRIKSLIECEDAMDEPSSQKCFGPDRVRQDLIMHDLFQKNDVLQ